MKNTELNDLVNAKKHYSLTLPPMGGDIGERMMDWHDATNEQALAEWDAGHSVWTCDMGGMGPGYEQCIQIMAFEMLRAMIANPPTDWNALSEDNNPNAKELWREYRDRIEKLPDVKAVIGKLQPSGAQFDAAMNIASVFAMNGYSKGMEKVPKDRRIQVSKNFPTLA